MTTFGEDKSEFEILKTVQSPYNDIYVIRVGDKRELWFKGKDGFFLQSRVDMENRNPLVLVYSRMMIATLLFQPSPKRILMVGLGGGALSNLLRKWYPQAHIDVVEIDRKVIEVSKDYFFLHEDENYRVIEADGRVFIKNQKGKELYDLVFLDAFKSGSIPFHLKTREFYQEIKEILSPEGVVGSNLYGKSNIRKPIDRNTFLSVFRWVYCFEDPDRVATVLVAANHRWEWSPGDIRREASRFRNRSPVSMTQVASMYRPGKFKDDEASVFHDDFSDGDFLKAAEKYNSDKNINPRYPIKCYP